MSLSGLVEKMSWVPAQILKIDRGHLSEGALADVTIFDRGLKWKVEKDKFESKSKNSPFLGWEMKGRATDVICEGRIVMESGKIA